MRGSKAQSNRRLEKLQNEADAVRCLAQMSGESPLSESAFLAADTLDAWCRRQRQELDATSVLEIEPNASDVELRAARSRQAVKRGGKVFLPTWRDATVGLPNLLLRSELFRATNLSEESVQETEIASQGDVSITFTGVRLTDYDRRVFAACLSYYRLDSPLAPEEGDDARWIRSTFYQLSLLLGVAYGENVHKAIRASLVRLNAAHLRIRVKGRDVPMPRLLDVAFDETVLGSRAKGVVAFRVLESMARLFGHDKWAAVSLAALNDYSGLPAWLASFYSTHKHDYPLKVADLYRYTGVVCSVREFRRRLKRALDQLQADDVPDVIRVKDYVIEGGFVTIRLKRWLSEQ